MPANFASLKLVTPATLEPVSAADMREHMRLEDTSLDSKLAALAKGARQAIETRLHRHLMSTTLRLGLDGFPPWAGNRYPAYTGSYVNNPYQIIYLPRPPVSSITSITYVDANGTTQALSSSVYRLDSDSEPARVSLQLNQSWPDTAQVTGAVLITYVSGYGATSASVPEAIRQAIMMLASDLFDHPGATAEMVLRDNQAYSFLLDAYTAAVVNG